MSSMTLSEAAAAYAAARCLAARVRDARRRVTLDHPMPCGWCDYPTDVIDRMVRGFNELADYDRRNGTSASDAIAFDRLDPPEQRRRITAAQQLEEPIPAPTEAVAETAEAPSSAPPPPPPWLGGPS